jgi:hypothetical protein
MFLCFLISLLVRMLERLLIILEEVLNLLHQLSDIDESIVEKPSGLAIWTACDGSLEIINGIEEA